MVKSCQFARYVCSQNAFHVPQILDLMWVSFQFPSSLALHSKYAETAQGDSTSCQFRARWEHGKHSNGRLVQSVIVVT